MDVDKLKDPDREADKPKNGLNEKRYTFSVSVEFHGEKLEGTFTNKILTQGDRADMDLVAARMRAGQPFESFSPDARLRQQMISHLVISLEEDRPDWAKEISDIVDLNVIGAIYEEVGKHEENFRKPRKDT
jgi:hypothetical protein